MQNYIRHNVYPPNFAHPLISPTKMFLPLKVAGWTLVNILFGNIKMELKELLDAVIQAPEDIFHEIMLSQEKVGFSWSKY